jgi:ribosome-associated toxin RatA of RatAB toxin-antitoxin module
LQRDIVRDLHGTASAVVSAPLERCVALLAAIDAYPDWYPDGVREVEVLERDAGGQPTRVRTVLHVQVAGFDRDFNLTMSVEADPEGRIALSKIKADSSDPPFDVTWRVSDDEGTRIELDLDTALPVPRLMPLGGVGDSIARSFVSAASEALGGEGT